MPHEQTVEHLRLNSKGSVAQHRMNEGTEPGFVNTLVTRCPIVRL